MWSSWIDRFPHYFVNNQVKLFKEWSSKWPEDYKIKLKEKIGEIDGNFAEKLNKEILNGYSNGNGSVGSGTSSPTDQAPPIAELQNEAIVAWAQLNYLHTSDRQSHIHMQHAFNLPCDFYFSLFWVIQVFASSPSYSVIRFIHIFHSY